MADYRLGADLDGDGFINWGVASGTPPNLFPGALYTAQSKLHGLQYTTAADVFEDVTDISDQGFVKRNVKLGKDGGGDYAASVRLGLGSYRTYQQRVGDLPNLISMLALPAGSTTVTGGLIDTGFTTGDATQDYKIGPVNAIFGSSSYYIQYFQNYTGSGGTAQGYWDGGNLYSKNIAGDATFGTKIPVTAGQSYTIFRRMYATTGHAVKVRIYGNNGTLGSPSYGRIHIASLNFTSVAGWQSINVQFTVPTGVTQIGWDLQEDTVNFDQTYFGPLIMVNGTTSAPDHFWDSAIWFDASQFSIVAEDNSPYIFSFWVKSDDGIDALNGSAQITQINTGNATPTVFNVAVTSAWARYNFTIPAAAYIRSLHFDWVATKGGVATGVGNVGTVQFKGFMLTKGSTGWPYHAGTSYEYDDLTNYTISASTKSGKSAFHESLAYEGTLTATLDNTSKIFSPENTASPIYGILDQNRRTLLQIWDGSVWSNLWSGWTTSLEITPGTSNETHAVLGCMQGLFRLREGTFSAPITTDTSLDTVVKKLIESSGWRSPTVPFQSAVGYGANVSQDFYTLDTTAMFGAFESGVNTLEFVGQDWGRKGNIESALKEALESENATLWIDRDGKLVFVNRNHWVNTSTPVEVYIDTTVQEAEYVYGKDITNRAEVIITRKKLTTSQAAWKTHRAFKVIPNKFPTDRVEIEIHGEQTSGRTKTAVHYTLEGSVKTVYTADPGITYTSPQTATQAQADKVIIELMPVGGGSLYRLRVTNYNSVPMWVDIQVNGDILDTEDGTPVIVEDTDAINAQEAVHSHKITTGILNTTEQAQSLGMFYVLRDASPAGEFVSITQRNEALSVSVPLVTSLSLGTKISIHEAQTTENGRVHWIIGEDFTISGNVITVRYTTARSFPGTFLYAGAPLTPPTANLVYDWTNVIALASNTASYDGTKITFNSIGATPLYLDPAPNQIVTYPLGWWIDGVNKITSSILVSGIKPSLRFSDPSFVVGSVYYGAGINGEGLLPLLVNTKYRVHMYGQRRPTQWAYSRHVRLGAGTTYVGITRTITNVTPTTGYDTATYTSGEFTTPTLAALGTTEYNNILYSRIETDSAGNTVDISSPATLVQMSGNTNGTTLDSTLSYKYSLFAKGDASQPDENKLCVLSVYNNVTGALIGTHSQELLPTMQKWEVSIPSGNAGVWATFQQTPFIGNYGVTYVTQPNTIIYIYGYGVTPASVSAYTDLLVSQNNPLVYP